MGAIIYGTFMATLSTFLVVILDLQWGVEPIYGCFFLLVFLLSSRYWKVDIDDKKEKK